MARSSLASVTGFNRLSASGDIRDIDYAFKSSLQRREGSTRKGGVEAEKRGGKSASRDTTGSDLCLIEGNGE